MYLKIFHEQQIEVTWNYIEWRKNVENLRFDARIGSNLRSRNLLSPLGEKISVAIQVKGSTP